MDKKKKIDKKINKKNKDINNNINNRNVKVNNFVSPNKNNNNNKQLNKNKNENTDKKKDKGAFLETKFREFKDKIDECKMSYSSKINQYKFFLQKEDKDLYEFKQNIEDLNKIMEELEAKHQEYQDGKINDGKFQGFILGNGNGLEERIENIERSLEKQIEQIQQKSLPQQFNMFAKPEEASEDQKGSEEIVEVENIDIENIENPIVAGVVREH